MMKKRTYPAVRVRQTTASGDLILFAAPATDIEDWSGIPQRERLGEDETVGFQREESEKRINELVAFYSDSHNVIQNPLLCASRDASMISFLPAEDSDAHGVASIEWEDLTSLPLIDLLRRVKANLEARLPELAAKPVSDAKLTRLKERANAEHPDLAAPDEHEDDGGGRTEDEEPQVDEPVDSVLFSEETHIADFWEEIASRVVLLDEFGPGFAGDSFLGFSREAMIAYLQPVVVVDGQHRLKGAILAAEQAVSSDALRAEVDQAVAAGEDPDQVVDRIKRREARSLPVSLLLDPSPAEHVFQFVVVNQKATPIGRALLGTIVSTSLSAAELAGVSKRLSAAGIPLQESQAIAYLTRHPDSPFAGLVEKGLTGEGTDLLQWNVLGTLVRIFRDLKGGKLYGEKIDYADKWRRDLLDDSALVSACPEELTKFDYWSRSDGPWRDVFVAFWTSVRNRLATTDDGEAGNYWGSPRKSNLFNKISLTILASDFFQFLCDRSYSIDSVSQVDDRVVEWLKDVKTSYFSRDWKLGGIKKDAPGIRTQWAYLWVQYRKDPVQLPQLGQFRQSRST